MKSNYEIINIDKDISNHKKMIAISVAVNTLIGIFSMSHAVAALKNLGESNYINTISNALVSLFDYGLFIFETEKLNKCIDELRLLKEKRKDV